MNATIASSVDFLFNRLLKGTKFCTESKVLSNKEGKGRRPFHRDKNHDFNI
jgi:hypothetical protein